MIRDAKASTHGRPKLLLGAAAALLLSLVLGVSLAGAVAPVVTIQDATDVTATGAKVKATVNPEDKDTHYNLNFSLDAAFTNPGTFAGGDLLAGSGTTAIEATASNLVPNTTYYVRVVASNADGASTAVAASPFTTLPVVPVVNAWRSSAPHSDGEAVIRGFVNPRNSALTDCHFEYGPTEAYGQSASCAPTPSQINERNYVSLALTGLEPGATYHFKLIATNAAGTVETVDASFVAGEDVVPEACPASEALGADFLPGCRAWEMVSPPDKNGGDVGADSRRVRSAADGSALGFTTLARFSDVVGTGIFTDYITERSADPDPGDSGWATHAITPAQGGESFQTLTNGLEPRYVGEFSADLDRGVYFTRTPQTAEPSVAKVLNLYRRTDLRTPGAGAYELLTPCPLCAETATALPALPETGSQAALLRPVIVGSTPDLGRIAFESSQKLTKDTQALTAGRVRLFEWSAQPRDELQKLAVAATAGQFKLKFGADTSADLPFDAPATTVEAALNALPSIAGPGGSVTVSGGPGDATGSSPYFIAFAGSLAGAPVPQLALVAGTTPLSGGSGASLTTAIDGGNLQLAGRTPTAPAIQCDDINGPACTAGAAAEVSIGGAGAGANHFTANTPHAISDESDGHSRIFFTRPTNPAGTGVTPGGADGNIYMREDGHRTVQLNATEKTVPGGFAKAKFLDASADGTRAFFTTTAILNDDPAAQNVLVKLYMYDATKPASALDNLTLVSVDAEPDDIGGGEVQGVVGVGGDGHYVYYFAAGQQVAGEPLFGGARSGLYLWHDGATTFIGQVPGTVQVRQTELMSSATNVGIVNFRQARVTPDGKHVLFTSLDGADLLGYDHGMVVCGVGCGSRQLYLYSAETDSVQCASCIPGGGPAKADATTVVRELYGGAQPGSHETKALSDDGRYAFFTSADSLIPGEDTNGVSDAYVYDTTTGKPRLLSSGEDPDPSYFLDATPNGSDAFFATREALSGWDVDGAYDIYDARVGGGFPEPPPPPPSCVGDACQPAPPNLNDPTPASSGYQGEGDTKAIRNSRSRCPKGKHRVKARNGKSRCVKKQGTANRERGATNNRRAGK